MAQPCLPVGKRHKGKVNFDDIESMDASDYLGRVVSEARRLPGTVVSSRRKEEDDDDDPASKKQKREMPIEGSAASLSYLVSNRTQVWPPPSSDYLPKDTIHWVDVTLETFSRLREYLERCQQRGVGGKGTNRLVVPVMKDRPGWHIFCVGRDDARGNEGAYFDDDGVDAEDQESAEETPPWALNLPEKGYDADVSLLLQMDQVMIRRVLSHLAHYVREGWPLNEKRALWLYALLARLERPIHREDACVLYGLLKSLTESRKGLTIGTDQAHLARLNVLIAIVGVYFEQGGGFANVFAVR